MKPLPAQDSSSEQNTRTADFMASIVVFLVALPLCIGIAVASGVPVERGLITGIVGGIIVGAVTGSPLLVSGPAASLLVLVWALVDQYGLAMLGPVVVGAGLVQMAAGLMGLGQWFRAVSPAVIRGMMAGIGVLIMASQLHVVLDGTPGSGLYANLSTFPGAFAQALAEGRPALWVGLLTIAALVGWKRLRPERLSLVPPQLVAVILVVAMCSLLSLDVLYLEVSGSLLDGLQITTPTAVLGMAKGGLLGQCLIFAFVASAATLLTATAIDQIQSEVQTDYDQELFAQGLGNSVAGALGGLPMTGVIVRSSANVEAGAKTRLSTFLHGIWLLVFVALFPQLLALIPKATLGAILVAVGVNLAHPDGFKKLDERDRSELIVGVITLVGVVGLDLFSGILLGFGASILRLVYAFTRFEVKVDRGEGTHFDVHLSGFATFIQLPQLAAALDAIPTGSHVTVHLRHLDYADHACFEQIAATERRLRAGEGSLDVEWEELLRRYKEGPTPTADAKQVGTLRRLLQGARRALGMGKQELARVAGHLEIDDERVFLDLPGGELDPTLEVVTAPLFAGLPGDLDELRRQFEEKAAGHALAIGEGVVLVHASLSGVDETRLAFARLKEPLRLASGTGDLLFVLLDGESDPEGHLLALGGLARICASTARLESLRDADSAEAALERIQAGIYEAEAEDLHPSVPAPGSELAVVELFGEAAACRSLEEALQRTFGTVAVLSSTTDPTRRLLAGAVRARSDSVLLLVDVPPDRLGSLNTLVDEFQRTSSWPPPEVHVLRPGPNSAAGARRAVGG